MKIDLSNLKDQLDKEYDVFIGSSSFEDRCLKVIDQLANHVHFKYKLVSISVPHKELVCTNYNVFVSRYGFRTIEVDNSDQLVTVDNILEPIAEILYENPSASFLVDISTFTRQTLIILLRLLRNTLTVNNKIQFLYTAAKEYAIGLPEEEKWLSRGILDINSVFGYSGVIRPSRPYHLIILMGYEVERACSLIEVYEPAKISIGYGTKEGSVSENHYELNLKRFDKLHSEFPNAESFEFSCVNVELGKEEILKQVSKYNDYNVVIAPMNNKVSTVSTALAAFDNDNIQIAIANPAVYNTEHYSSSDDYCLLLEINDFIKL